MPGRSTHSAEATRQARWTLRELGRELRLARRTSGLTQVEVARRAGTSAAQLSRLENGLLLTASFVVLNRMAAAVGLRLYCRALPGGRRLLDKPQLTLLDRLRARIHASWRWQLEVPLPRPGDLRAVDAVLTLPGCTIAVEAITRLADLQAQLRAARIKARDLGADRLILLVSGSTANRQALLEASDLVATALPMTTRRALATLAAGADPGADALIIL
ncbi:MAG TPA: helix-turn-helix transcriptional regulator [Candidatus Limnocylindrales bacterium]|nr:helix-turn-helix transcriptional regulator [Candidatus Limnocylindrales bacterium]